MRCSLRVEKETLADRAKRLYAAKLMEGASKVPALIPKCSPCATSEVIPKGWALKPARKNYKFNDKQKNYLEAKFNHGQESGHKADAEVVAKEMRRARDMNGKRLFTTSEFLTEQQVASFFSRMAAKVRGQPVPLTVDDSLAIQGERDFRESRNAVLSSTSMQHPILCNQYNICAMVRSKSLEKLKLPMLQHLCQQFCLDAPRVRKKAPYLSLLEKLVSGCSCSES